MKRILTIQDLSCFGKCSITITLPVLSAMGVETAVLPTMVLSTHTMFQGYTVKELSDQLVPIARHWKSQDIRFDAVYTGYLGSAQIIGAAEQVIDLLKGEDTLLLIDPVMGDHGSLYAGFDADYPEKCARFCSKGDMIVPNLTEACLLTGTEYRTEYDAAYIRLLLDRLALLGPRIIVLTGVSFDREKIGFCLFDTSAGEMSVYQTERVDASCHGSGDLFASVSAGALVQGIPIPKAFEIAAEYTARTIRATVKEQEDPRYGAAFEKTLPDLREMLSLTDR